MLVIVEQQYGFKPSWYRKTMTFTPHWETTLQSYFIVKAKAPQCAVQSDGLFLNYCRCWSSSTSTPTAIKWQMCILGVYKWYEHKAYILIYNSSTALTVTSTSSHKPCFTQIRKPCKIKPTLSSRDLETLILINAISSCFRSAQSVSSSKSIFETVILVLVWDTPVVWCIWFGDIVIHYTYMGLSSSKQSGKRCNFRAEPTAEGMKQTFFFF